MLGKSDMAKKVAAKTGLTGVKATAAVNATLDAITEAVWNGDEVRLVGFGNFKVTETKERRGRNPRTGEPLTIPAGRRLSFTPGTRLVQALRV